jgi:hypothetical protein
LNVFVAFVCVSQSHIAKDPHITGIFFWVTEQDLRHKTEIPVAMTRLNWMLSYDVLFICSRTLLIWNSSSLIWKSKIFVKLICEENQHWELVFMYILCKILHETSSYKQCEKIPRTKHRNLRFLDFCGITPYSDAMQLTTQQQCDQFWQNFAIRKKSFLFVWTNFWLLFKKTFNKRKVIPSIFY